MIDETAPTARPQGGYGAAKLAAETLCRQAVSAGLPVTVLRPALIWGPGSNLWTSRYIERLRSGRCHALGKAGEGVANLVHIEDLVGFIAHLLRRPTPRAEAIYNVNGTQSLSWNAYFAALSKALHCSLLPPRRFPRLALAFRLAVRSADKVLLDRLWPTAAPAPWQALREQAKAIPSRDETRRFAARLQYDNARMRGTGYEPRYGLARGVAELVNAASEADEKASVFRSTKAR